jgi:iron complex transport system ATP-binding protein
VPQDTPLLAIRGATVRKGAGRGRVILDEIELEISLGEHTAILGPNGSGKTSLIRLITQEYRPLARLERPSGVRIFGKDRWDLLELRKSLGVVSPDVDRDFSDALLGMRVRALDAVISGFFASPGIQPHQTVSPAMRSRAAAALALMEASHLRDKSMDEMSTGEARRVLIARGLAPDPPALLLDEPTAGLDIVARRRFLDTLRGLARSGKTIILVTHHVEEIIPEVDRVVLLREGRIVRDGPKEDVLTSAGLSASFGAPVEVESRLDGYFVADIMAPAQS